MPLRELDDMLSCKPWLPANKSINIELSQVTNVHSLVA
jgi:hypothetical protein